MDERLHRALAAIDEANAADPEHPRSVAYAEAMMRWLERLEPEADDALRIGARAQHVRRWEIPRASYPEGRRGYKQWRAHAQRHHAEVTGRILAEVGYGPEMIDRVSDLLCKRRLRSDPESQRLEDVACLVFLERELASFAARHPRHKLVAILRKTWGKMSEPAREVALGLPLRDDLRALVEEALGGTS